MTAPGPAAAYPSIKPYKEWLGIIAALLLTATFFCSLFFKQYSPEYLGLAGFGLLGLVILALWWGRQWAGGIYWLPFGLVAAFWGWWLLSSLWSPVAGISMKETWHIMSLPAVAFAGLLLGIHTRFLRYGILLISVVIAFLALYACVQVFVFSATPSAGFFNKNSFAALQLPIVMMAIVAAISGSHARHSKLLALTLTFLLVFVIGLIASRGALLAMLSGLLFIFFMAWHERVPRKPLVITVAIIIAALMATNLAGLGGMGDQMSTLTNPETAGQDRFFIWKASLAMAADAPWYGIGPALFSLLYPVYRLDEDRSAGFWVHNDYLQFFIEAGWPALLLIVAVFASLIWLVMRALIQKRGSRAHRLEITGLFAGMGVVAGHSLLTFNLYQMPILIVLGLFLARLLVLLRETDEAKGTLTIARSPGPLPLRILLSLALLFPGVFYGGIIGSSLHFTTAMTELNEGDASKGAKHLEKAINWWPQMDLYHYAHAWHLLQRAKASFGAPRKERLEEAHARLDKAQQLNPFRPQPYVVRGLIYQETKTSRDPDLSPTEAAEEEFRQALKLDPFYLQARFLLGRLLLGNNRIEEGTAILEAGVNKSYQNDKLTLNYYILTAEMRRILGDPEGHAELMKTVEKVRSKMGRQEEQVAPGISQPAGL